MIEYSDHNWDGLKGSNFAFMIQLLLMLKGYWGFSGLKNFCLKN
jgi:hypothetical protein